MNFRPEGWKNPNEEYYNVCDVPTVQDGEYEAYEAGADAMIDALFELAKQSPTGTFVIDSKGENIL